MTAPDDQARNMADLLEERQTHNQLIFRQSKELLAAKARIAELEDALKIAAIFIDDETIAYAIMSDGKTTLAQVIGKALARKGEV